jgi:hypothetical protein
MMCGSLERKAPAAARSEDRADERNGARRRPADL